MKTCLICGELCSTDVTTCPKCGEASWTFDSASGAPDKEPQDVTSMDPYTVSAQCAAPELALYLDGRKVAQVSDIELSGAAAISQNPPQPKKAKR